MQMISDHNATPRKWSLPEPPQGSENEEPQKLDHGRE